MTKKIAAAAPVVAEAAKPARKPVSRLRKCTGCGDKMFATEPGLCNACKPAVPTCCIDGCEKPANSRKKMCRTHYRAGLKCPVVVETPAPVKKARSRKTVTTIDRAKAELAATALSPEDQAAALDLMIAEEARIERPARKTRKNG